MIIMINITIITFLKFYVRFSNSANYTNKTTLFFFLLSYECFWGDDVWIISFWVTTNRSIKDNYILKSA